MSFGFGLGFPKSAIAAGIQPALNLQFAGSQVLDPRITFTRASSATYFNSAGVLQRATYNLLTRSEEFNDAAWGKTGVSVTANSIVAPDGTTTADTITGDGVSGAHHVNQASTTGTQTISVFAKKGTNDFLQIAVGGTTAPYANFNLALGTTSAFGAGTTSSITELSAGSGWYRCVMTTTDALASGIRLALVTSLSAARLETNTLNTTVFLWGAQVEAASTAGPYWATTTAANGAPRFDYNPSTLAPLGLLIEEQRTNSIRNNTMQGAVAGTPGTVPTNWSYGQLSTLTTQIVGTGTEAGVAYVDIRISGTATTTAVVYFEANSTVVATNGQTWSSSAFVKLVGGSTANITAPLLTLRMSGSGGANLGFVPGSEISLPGSGQSLAASRFSSAHTTNNASTAFVMPAFAFNAAGAIDITLRIGLPQLEQGAFATSVIPTTTAAATRAADNATMTGTNFSSWYNQTEGTLYAEADTVETGTTSGGAFVINVSDGGSNNLHRIFRQSDTQPVMQTLVSGVAQTTFGFGANWTTTTPRKLAYAYKLNDFAGVVDAGAVQVDTSGTVPTVNQIDIGNGGGATQINGHIRRIAYFNTRLANANLQALTS